jgi:ribonuclease D
MLTRSAELAEFSERAAQSSFIAMDTEFMRESTYYPELCLIQAALPDEIVLIDPLADEDMSALMPIICAGPVKIMHSCRQDQEVLAMRFGAGARPLFDTQVAAALCGHPPQWSYAKLVQEFSGVALAKTATRTDWSRRPLSTVQLDYAADDVRYLEEARDALVQRLQDLGRKDWFDQEMRSLEALSLEVAPLDAWSRVKGFGRLEGAALATLQHLAAWRERFAMERNRPRRWIASDPALLSIAQGRPQLRAELAALADVEPALLERRTEALLECVQLASDAPAPPLDNRIPDKAAIKLLQNELRRIAQDLNLDSSLLATRSDINALVLGQPCPNVQQGWRKAVVGDALMAML